MIRSGFFIVSKEEKGFKKQSTIQFEPDYNIEPGKRTLVSIGFGLAPRKLCVCVCVMFCVYVLLVAARDDPGALDGLYCHDRPGVPPADHFAGRRARPAASRALGRRPQPVRRVCLQFYVPPLTAVAGDADRAQAAPLRLPAGRLSHHRRLLPAAGAQRWLRLPAPGRSVHAQLRAGTLRPRRKLFSPSHRPASRSAH